MKRILYALAFLAIGFGAQAHDGSASACLSVTNYTATNTYSLPFTNFIRSVSATWRPSGTTSCNSVGCVPNEFGQYTILTANNHTVLVGNVSQAQSAFISDPVGFAVTPGSALGSGTTLQLTAITNSINGNGGEICITVTGQ